MGEVLRFILEYAHAVKIEEVKNDIKSKLSEIIVEIICSMSKRKR
jgi:hypothetical protein